mgnify:CR=1 FL=1
MSTDGPFVGSYRCAVHDDVIPCYGCRAEKYLIFKNALIEIATYGSANPQHGFTCASMAKTALSQAGELGPYPLQKEKE